MRLNRIIRSTLFLLLLLAFTGAAFAQIGVAIRIGFAPPPLPVYEQPLCPGDGYIWTPGYWAWDDDAGSYYWVPGTWVMAPEVGYLWTPPWWGWDGGMYLFHAGWWGPHVGFYGGINYGFGYTGDGYWGGRWQGGHFFYNREVSNINITNIRNVYNERVTVVNDSHVAYNGGSGGIGLHPTPEQERWDNERHVGAVAAQEQHVQQARNNPELRASENHGRPPIAATARPADFKSGVVQAREAGGAYRPEEHEAHPASTEARNVPRPPNTGNAVHAKDLPPTEHLEKPNTGNPKLDAKYQKQQDKLYAQQEKDRQKLQAQQDKEHAQLAKQNANAERQQQLEQKHQQQTQALAQRHTQQRQELSSRQAPPSGGNEKKR